MSDAMVSVTLRVPEELKALCEKAAAIAEARNLSEWAREALLAGAQTEISQYQAQQRRTSADGLEPTQPPSRSAVRGVHRDSNGEVPTGRCVHPSPARVQTPEAEVCGLCNVVTKWRI